MVQKEWNCFSDIVSSSIISHVNLFESFIFVVQVFKMNYTNFVCLLTVNEHVNFKNLFHVDEMNKTG